MKHKQPPPQNHDEVACYEIRLKGHLSEQWFENYRVVHDQDGTTQLHGTFDQSALFGLLRKVRDFGIVLIAVMQVEDAHCDKADE